jgi:hypothetical protein
MFSLFADPFYYRPAYRYRLAFNPFAYARATDIFDRYLDAFENQFFAALADDRSQMQDNPRADAPEAPVAPAPAADAKQPESSETTAPPQNPEQSQAQTQAQAQVQSESQTQRGSRQSPQAYGRQYVFQKRATWDGQNYVEEHRERVKGHDGESRTVVRRRLGDRWYENETHTDKDGKTTERETWHNVADDQIDNFKLEWSQKHSEKPEAPKEAPKEALESSSKPTGD